MSDKTNKTQARTLALFCRVVDNYGDIGICWRLARQLQHEHGVAVTLWVDDLASFKRICPALAQGAAAQMLEGVAVRHWRDQHGVFAPHEVAGIVIEFFACDIPPGYIAAMAQCTPRPVWLNLEGLSAEEWVEGCHTLPSPHPRLPLTKHFFFPGFTGKTGGLLREAGLDARRERFQSEPAGVAAFLAGLGLDAAERAATKVSLFCYPDAPVAALFGAWRDGARALTCLVPEGVAPAALHDFFEGGAGAGAARTRGALTVRVIPFVSQPDYDKLLWACDLNFVRGEDSFVRAQWAGRPFIWHIYPQDENLHHKKLRAFLGRYAGATPAVLSPGLAALSDFSLCWNGAPPARPDAPAAWPLLWKRFDAEMAELAPHARAWRRQMRENGDLAGNLLAFAAAPGS
ncbi:elongation factor P maturation arginine rhamnosyltransferase EarP [Massilia glaciei]|uniref:Protein-arginine rhamnosyltransferase n=1 Tax=Massilia glaciei TaxID=1524097 RepID=A0A2U2I4Q7_9BURK|nr:elongation factor P maturation arginine rhamnosyltransferase EarP [Massilia glaciei]PWF54652.1 elongation factor P maturation arginine rhamnosyltransferase EarP [Massilia glaciei]